MINNQSGSTKIDPGSTVPSIFKLSPQLRYFSLERLLITSLVINSLFTHLRILDFVR